MRLPLLILLVVASAQCSRKECCQCPADASEATGRRIQARPSIGADYFRRHKIKEMAQHAWRRTRLDNNTLSIVSAVSTLHIMGLRAEFEEGVAMIQRNNMVGWFLVANGLLTN